MLLDNSAWEKIGDVLSSSDFYKSEHRIILRALSINRRKQAGRCRYRLSTLKSQGVDEQCGGIAYLNRLAQATPGVAHAVQYARIVRDQSILRSLLTASEDIAQMALVPGAKTTGLILDDAEAKIFRISENRNRTANGLLDFDRLLKNVIKNIDELYNNPNPSDVTGKPSGFIDLDQKTAGMHDGD